MATTTVNNESIPTSKALTSVEIISTIKFTTVSHSTSTIIPLSNTTVTVIISPTTPQCEKCLTECIRGTCLFNATFGGCHCHCHHDFVNGDSCSFGNNDTPAHVDTGALPTRNATVTLEINITFQAAFNNLNSPQSLEFIKKFEQQLEALCKEADPQTFKKVQVIKLTRGSVVAESVVEYIYPNNETQIQFVNNQLVGVLTGILNDSSKLIHISQAFDNSTVKLNKLIFHTPEITNITDLMPFVNCSGFANYTAELVNGQLQCAGHCKTNPDYCHQHGECRNDIYKGPTCRCFNSSLEQFYGPQCNSSTEQQSTSVTTMTPTGKMESTVNIYNNDVFVDRTTIYICHDYDSDRKNGIDRVNVNTYLKWRKKHYQHWSFHNDNQFYHKYNGHTKFTIYSPSTNYSLNSNISWTRN
ncbi:mucin-3A-like [Sebastes umbrosus]|uniref:mucin-3A-like n=1 Tax=Sebastes umbrosus TaxID=72105 RepID=UPI00189E212A|nr:mucin-3A-like [Sebastes umbrosus]